MLDLMAKEACNPGTLSDLMRRALNHLHTFWKLLFAYRNDGEYTIDNLVAERTIRNMTIQRKNSLFFCSDKGARNSAIYNTFISTCPKSASDDNRGMKISEKSLKLTIRKFNDPALRAVKRVYTQFWTDTIKQDRLRID